MQIDLSDKEIKFLIRVLLQNYAEKQDDFVQGMNLSSHGSTSDLLNKIMYEDWDAFKKAQKEKYLEEPVNEKVFMGSGAYSIDLMNRYHKRLAYAFCELGGDQQNGGMGSDYNQSEHDDAIKNIKDVIKDLLVAFNLSIDDLK